MLDYVLTDMFLKKTLLPAIITGFLGLSLHAGAAASVPKVDPLNHSLIRSAPPGVDSIATTSGIAAGNYPGEGLIISRYDQMGHIVPLFKRPMFVRGKYVGGNVLKTDKTLRGDYEIPYAQYGEIKFGFSSVGNVWQDVYWGMPYYGIGVGLVDFDRSDLGTPFTLYLMHGGTICRISDKFRLDYEWNLGAAMNWNKFDEKTNPTNQCVGSFATVYIAANVNFSWKLSKNIDLNFGGSFAHYSNGATKMPNSGINIVGGFVELAYNFSPDRVIPEHIRQHLQAPHYQPRLVSDFMFAVTSRQRKANPSMYGLSSKYIDRDFFAASLSYSLMHQTGHKWRYGLGLDLVYDESACFTPTEDSAGKLHVKYGDAKDRFALGMSVRGEFDQRYYSIFALMGYNLWHNNPDDVRFYQQIGVKVPFSGGIYGSFSIRSKRFSKAQYLLFGLGYKLEHGSKKRTYSLTN